MDEAPERRTSTLLTNDSSGAYSPLSAESMESIPNPMILPATKRVLHQASGTSPRSHCSPAARQKIIRPGTDRQMNILGQAVPVLHVVHQPAIFRPETCLRRAGLTSFVRTATAAKAERMSETRPPRSSAVALTPRFERLPCYYIPHTPAVWRY